MFRRWLFRGLVLMLLTLCVAAWGVSYWKGVGFARNVSGMQWILFDGGRVTLANYFSSVGAIGPPSGFFCQLASNDWTAFDAKASFHVIGFSYVHGTFPVPVGAWTYWMRGFTIPLWFPTLISAGVCWVVWRKTWGKPMGRAFPVEPIAQPATTPMTHHGPLTTDN